MIIVLNNKEYTSNWSKLRRNALELIIYYIYLLNFFLVLETKYCFVIIFNN